MVLNLSIKNNRLHHAYCILGDTLEVLNNLHEILATDLGFSIINNPDYWYGEFDIMDVDDSRAIKVLHQNKPTVGNKKIYVVSANFITEKAQNAMLKLFEEPRGDTHFFLILPSLNNIISTFKSRLFVVDSNKKVSSLIDSDVFLTLSVGKRIEIVKKICESISDEDQSKIEIIKFLNSLEAGLKKRFSFLKIKNDELKMFEEIEKIRQYAGEQSPSLKMLLEHISLRVPVFND